MTYLQGLQTKIITFAVSNGWKHLKTQDFCLNFEKKEIKTIINVYWDQWAIMDIYPPVFSVQTALFHPKNRRRTQLTRRKINMVTLGKIFINPRTHTGKGYYQKHKQK